MKTIHNYTFDLESLADQLEAKRYNPATELHRRDRKGKYKVTLGCGSSDDVSVYLDSGLMVVLTVNRSLDYCGIEVFKRDEMIGEMFLQTDFEISDVLGRKGLDYENITIAKILFNHCMEAIA